MRAKLIVAFGVSCLLALAVLPVGAAVITHTASHYGEPDWNQTFSIPQLNPSVGILNAVSLEITGSGTASLSYHNSSPSSASNKALIDLTWEVDRGTQVLLNDTQEWYQPWTTPSGGDYNGGPWTLTPSPVSLLLTNPDDLAYFTGTGSADFTASGSNCVALQMGGGNYSISIPTALGLSMSVSYNYSAVPEPSVLTLLGIGAISLVVYAWRRRG
jgi:hypothetical protein